MAKPEFITIVHEALRGRTVFTIEEELRQYEAAIDYWTSRGEKLPEHVTPHLAHAVLKNIAQLKAELKAKDG